MIAGMKTSGGRRVRPPCYQAWINIRRWCGVSGNNPNHYYSGVTVCEEWASDYRAFEEWCISHGWRKGLFIVRIDKDKDYCPENCILVPIEVANGLRRCVRRMADGRSARDIIGRDNLCRDRQYHNRVARRIFEGRWDVDSAISAPLISKFMTKTQKKGSINE